MNPVSHVNIVFNLYKILDTDNQNSGSLILDEPTWIYKRKQQRSGLIEHDQIHVLLILNMS